MCDIEVFIERPSNLLARACTWSSYKHHNTVKFLIGIAAFIRGKDQLSAAEVEETRSLANVRIHVERVIGAVRQKFSILQGTLPIYMITMRAGEECPIVDRIGRVCCALSNICDSVVPFN